MEEIQPQNNQERNQLSKRERRELRRMERRNESKTARRKNLAKSLGIWIAVIILLGGGIWGMVILAKNSGGGNLGEMLSGDILASDWVKGNPEADVKLVEYSDFQCPACAYYYPWLKQLADELGNDMAFVYRHFPLTTIHRNAQAAALATEAAGRQGKFWEMHDKLFESQSEWSDIGNVRSKFSEYAASLGLNREQFEDDLDSREVRDKVQRDTASGNAAVVQGTPTFFLNGRKIDNPVSYDAFKAILLNEIQN